jgi:hypothetical protein
MPCYTCGDKGLCPLAYVLQIYATFLSQHFNEFLRPAYGINNLSKSLHQFWVWSSEFGVWGKQIGQNSLALGVRS